MAVALLQGWYDQNADVLLARGLRARLHVEEDGPQPPHSLALDIDADERMGRLLVWRSGSAHLQVLEASGDAVLDEHRDITSRIGLEDAIESMLTHMLPS